MSLYSKKILDIRITTSPKEKILEYIKKYLVSPGKKPLVIVTPNPEQIMLAQTNPAFRNIMNRADLSLPDGIGVAWAAGTARIPGVEFMEELVRLALAQGVTIGLIGGRVKVAVRALECLSRQIPGLSGWAVEPEELSTEKIAEKIQKTYTCMVFVGLGAPKQEFLIEELRTHCPELNKPLVLMSVGGSFDILSGSIQRAPVFMRLIGLEWLWRLLCEPWRWRRQLALVQFLVSLVRDKLSLVSADRRTFRRVRGE